MKFLSPLILALFAKILKLRGGIYRPAKKMKIHGKIEVFPRNFKIMRGSSIPHRDENMNIFITRQQSLFQRKFKK